MKFLLDSLPALVFLGAYFLYDIYAATIALIVSLFGLVIFYWFAEKKLHKAHFITALVALALGGLTIYLHNDTFIQYKPTLVYGIFALALAGSHVIGDKVLLQRMGEKSVPLPEPVWRKVNIAWVVYFAFSAVLNIWVAKNFSYDTWMLFKFPGTLILMFVFMVAHAPFLGRYLQEAQQDQSREQN
ncbi:inner membrane-spanning protein YciB [Solimonas sp. SE-A11]|uniref:inner membrane-spanning protein YciB n=1 Tax=Solimonas sp. SE-A11 TaxID=3054954 RepID=UPI00259C6F6C|nr:inner membrane-spanning protein YciB [Solimonas sp. SE-A11]MDM4771136.1 inner membrane-spanning protein YciB [Solimonas sp. SE-A11]